MPGAHRACLGGWLAFPTKGRTGQGPGRLRAELSEGSAHLCPGSLAASPQGTMVKVSVPSSSLPPASSQTAALPTTTTSWSTSSCKWPPAAPPFYPPTFLRAPAAGWTRLCEPRWEGALLAPGRGWATSRPGSEFPAHPLGLIGAIMVVSVAVMY